MKKYILNLFVSTFFLIASFSCSGDWLDLSPSDGLPKENAITNFNEGFVALNGMYDAIQGRSSLPSYYGARMIYYGDVRGDDMQSTPAGSRTQAVYLMNYASSSAPQIWEVPYKVIRRANSMIEAIDAGKMADATQDQSNDMKGQALMARALAHFDLLRVYSQPYSVSNGAGLGIPIVTKPEYYTYTPTRNTMDEVYKQVIEDLSSAISLMPAKRANTSVYKTGIGYFNTWAAKALLARVYLYKGDNTNAYSTAIDVINNSGYKLWASEEYSNVWEKAGTSEVLFEIVNASNDDWVDKESIGYLYNEKEGYTDAVMTKKFIDLMKTQYADDVRWGVMLPSRKVSASKPEWGDNKVHINKYPGREDTNNDSRINNLSILRLSEQYLIAAEAAAKLSDQVNAAKYLNAIVLRGNPKATEVPSTEATLDRILQERRVEFVGEGHRFFDLIRNNQTVLRYLSDDDKGWHMPLTQESRSFNVNYFRVILPIPEIEISANPAIRGQQNPGY